MCCEADNPSDSFACVMRLHTKTFVARDAASASGIPLTRRFGISEVYSDPGPSVMMSA